MTHDELDKLWDLVNFIGVPIHLDTSDEHAIYIYEEDSDIILLVPSIKSLPAGNKFKVIF